MPFMVSPPYLCAGGPLLYRDELPVKPRKFLPNGLDSTPTLLTELVVQAGVATRGVLHVFNEPVVPRHKLGVKIVFKFHLLLRSERSIEENDCQFAHQPMDIIRRHP